MNGDADIAHSTLRRLFEPDLTAVEATSSVVTALRDLSGAQIAAVLRFYDQGTPDIAVFPTEREALLRQPSLLTYLQQAAESGTTVLWRNPATAEQPLLPELEQPTTALFAPFPIDHESHGMLCAFAVDFGENHAKMIRDAEMMARALGLVLRGAALAQQQRALQEKLERFAVEHKQEEQQLRIALLALETTRESVHWVDEDGQIIYANPATENELGYTADELRRMHVSDIDPHIPAGQFRLGSGTEADRPNGVRKFHTEHRRKDGSMLPVEIDADAFVYAGKRYYIAIGHDISDRVAAEKALRESEAKFSAMFSLSPDPLVRTRLADGVMLEINHSFTDTFGYTREEAEGRSTLPGALSLWLDPEQRKTWRARLEQSGELRGYEVQMRRKDGSIITVLMSAKVVDIGGERCAIVDVHDISQRKLAEEELRRERTEQAALIKKLEEAQNQLLQSEKLASIGQLAAGVAHEINNPIGYVGSNLGTLKEYIDELLDLIAAYEESEPLLRQDAQAFELIAKLKRNGDIAFLRDDIRNLINESIDGAGRVRRIVQDLRDFSRVGATDWQRYDLHAGLDSTINVVWNEIKYKAELVREYGDIPQVECIPSQLNQVFMNLLVNAAQAIPERGTITVHTECADDEVRVAVSDTGQGIAPEYLAKVFDPFFTTKPVGKGTGLGLSVSYNIINHHNGRIEVHSEPGKGTTFTIRLPVEHAPATDATAAGDG